MLKIRSIQDGARVLWCVRDLLAAIENTTSVTKYTEKVAASDKLKIALGEGGKNKQETLFVATDAAINLLMRSRSDKAAAVIAFIKSDGEPAKPVTTKQDNPISNVFDEFSKRTLRTLFVDGKEWFCAYDVTQILEYENGRKATEDHCLVEGRSKAYLLVTPLPPLWNMQPHTTFIDLPNVMRLIFRSTMPNAIAFSDYILNVVIPSLHKTGVAFRSEEDKMEYDLDTFERVAWAYDKALRLNNLEYQKKKYKENKEWFAKIHEGEFTKFEGQVYVEFDKQRDAEYGLLPVKEAQKVAEKQRLENGIAVTLPAAFQKDKILINEYIARGSALRAAFKDETFWLSLTEDERAEWKKELDMLERVTARFQLLPCVKRTETLIVSSKPLPAIGAGTQLTLEAAKENRQYLAAQA